MKKLQFIVVCVLILLISSNSFCGDLSITLADQANHLNIKMKNGKSKLVDIDKYVASRKIEELRILSQPRNPGKFQYAVIQVNGYLHGECRDRGYCGCGEEENTIWLKLDDRLNIVEAQSYLTGSCRESIEGYTTLRHDGSYFDVEINYSKPSEDIKNRFGYSSNKP